MRKFQSRIVNDSTLQIDVKTAQVEVTPSERGLKLSLSEWVVNEYLLSHDYQGVTLDQLQDFLYDWFMTTDVQFEPFELRLTVAELYDLIRSRIEALVSRAEIQRQKEYRKDFRELRQKGFSSHEARRKLKGGMSISGSGKNRQIIFYGKETKSKSFSLDVSRAGMFYRPEK